MWLRNKLLWALKLGQPVSSPYSPPKLLEPWPHRERLLYPNRSCRARASAQHRSSLTPHSSFLSQTRAYPGAQDHPKAPLTTTQPSPFLMQLLDPPSLCTDSHRYKETLLVKEPSRGGSRWKDSGSCYQDCPWNPRLISEGSRSQYLVHK